MNLKWIFAAVIAFLVLVLGIAIRFPSALNGAFTVLRAFIFIILLLCFMYPVLYRVFGVELNREGRKLRIRLPSQMNTTPGGEFASALGTLSRFAYLGFRDITTFREELSSTESPIMRKEILVWIGAFACLNYGIINVPFSALFWMCLAMQFTDDPGAASHVAACESLLGLLFLAAKPFHLPISALYLVFGVIWIGMYAMSADRSLKTLLLQIAKLLIFTASIFVPYYLNHPDAFHF